MRTFPNVFVLHRAFDEIAILHQVVCLHHAERETASVRMTNMTNVTPFWGIPSQGMRRHREGSTSLHPPLGKRECSQACLYRRGERRHFVRSHNASARFAVKKKMSTSWDSREERKKERGERKREREREIRGFGICSAEYESAVSLDSVSSAYWQTRQCACCNPPINDAFKQTKSFSLSYVPLHTASLSILIS